MVELDPLWGELLLGLLDLVLERGLLVLSEVFLYLVLLYWMWPDWKLGFLIMVFFLDSLLDDDVQPESFFLSTVALRF